MSDIIRVGDSYDLSLDQIALIEQLRQNPVAAAKVLLGVDLHWYQVEALEDFFLNNKRFALLKWSRQLGKCSHYKSLILIKLQRFSNLQKIIKRIELYALYELLNNDKDIKNVDILTLNQETNKFEWTNNFSVNYNGKKKVYKVKTALGREVILTDNHPLRKLYDWVEVKDIKIKDKIAVPRIENIFNNSDTINNNDIKMLAYMIGDGCTRNMFCFTSDNIKNKEEFRKISFDIFNINNIALIYTDKFHDYIIEDNNLKGLISYDTRFWVQRNEATPKCSIDWCKKYKIWNKLSYDKRVPEEIFSTSKRQIALFLSRLFATDGWASINNQKANKYYSKDRQCVDIGYCSVNKDLTKDVQHLLLRFGIISKVSDKPVEYIRKDGTKTMAYQLHIGDSRSILTFCDEIGIFGKEEAVSACRELAASKDNNNRDVIPIEIWDYIREKVNEKLVIEKERQKKWLKESGNKIPRSQRISLRNWDREGLIRRKELTPQHPYAPQRDKVLKYAEFLNDDYLRSLANSDLYWDEVVSIEYVGEDDTYDLAVPGPDNGGRDGKYRNFICDDILVHNTFLEAVTIALQCLLYPEEVGIFLAPSQRQSLNPMNTLLRCYNNNSIFKGLVSRKTKGHIEFKNGSEITSLPQGDGCVNDCYIMRYNGFEKIDNIVGNNKKEKEKVYIKDKISGIYGYKNNDYYFYNGYVDIKKIKTNYGFSLNGSLIHPIKILRENIIDWVKYNDLKISDYILVDRTENWFEECNNISYDDAYSIGALIGDGSYCTPSHSSYISFSNDIEDNEIVEYINNSNFFQKYNLKFKRLENDCNHLISNGSNDIICKYFNEFGINRIDFENNKTKNKKFPKEILSVSKKSMIGFIQGLMDTDGSVCKSKHKDSGLWLEFTNTSYELVRVLQMILLKFGIISNIRERDRNEKWEIIYDLFMTGTNVRKFYNKIGFRLNRKQSRLKELLLNKKVDKDIKDLVPHAPILILNLLEKVRREEGKISIVRGKNNLRLENAYKNYKKNKGLTYKYIKNILDYFIEYSYLEEYKELEKVYNDNYFYDKIVSIEDDKADTYDVYIPEGHTFWSNGFISHNSKVLGQHATIAGIDEYARFSNEYVTSIILPMLNQPGKNGLPNKLITLSTPLSKQNHFYRWYLSHKKHQKDKNTIYHLSEYDYRDSPTIDLGIIQMSLENSSWEQFARENLGIFTDNIDGFFSNELIYQCVEEEEGEIKIQNVPDSDGKKYVLGIDPSNMVMKDRFAIYLYEVIEYEGGGLGLLFANAWSFDKETIPRVEDLIRRIMIIFDIIRCHIDAGGGGRQIAEHLMEPKVYHDDILNEDINWTGCQNADISDKTPQRGGNEVPIKIIPYSSEKKNRMFFNLKNLMVKRLFKLPKNNLHDKAYVESNLLKDELENIVTRTLNNNLLEYSHPENVGDDRVNATALAVDAFWEAYYGQTQSSATIVRGIENRPFNSNFDISKPRDFNYRERELF